MCYDISFKTSIKTLEDYLPGISIEPQLKFDFDNIHVIAQAFSKVPIIIFEDGNYKLHSFEWGVIADYMNTPEKIKQGRQWMCNAQSEKILGDKRSYWHRIRNKRCLIPVTGIYEHREIKGWKKKVPYFIRMKEREMFCLPGLYHYAPFPDPETGEAFGTFTLITRSGNELLRKIHNGGTNAFRMPLFLTKELETKWLLPDLSDEEMKQILDFEMPSEELAAWPVYTIRSSKPRPDSRQKVDEFAWEGLPPL